TAAGARRARRSTCLRHSRGDGNPRDVTPAPTPGSDPGSLKKEAPQCGEHIAACFFSEAGSDPGVESAGLEEVREGAAHLELLGTAPEGDLAAAGVVEGDGGDGADVDDGAAVHLPEMPRVELGDELAQRLLHQRFALGRDDAR